MDGRILCVHAGLSPSINTIDQINTIERRMEVPADGPFADLLWSDPKDEIDYWGPGDRGAGYSFGKEIVRQVESNSIYVVQPLEWIDIN